MHHATYPTFYLLVTSIKWTNPAGGFVFDNTAELKEYCETDSFQAYCGDDSVVVMTEARYGRMEIGRCVKQDLGYIGCHRDVLGLLDARCSGKQSCQVRIPDPELDQTRPCLEELKTYLKAAYQCVHVDTPFGSCAGSEDDDDGDGGGDVSWSITRSSRTGFISTGTMVDTQCGSGEHSPIRISAWPGQRLNVTVYDFGHALVPIPPGSFGGGGGPGPAGHLPGATGSEADCDQFVVLFDPESKRQVKVCPGVKRERNVYVSVNRTIDVFFKRLGSDVYEQRFLIQYTVLGCAEIRPADEMWLSLNENDAHIGCRTSEQKWRLRCVDNRWQGSVGNCSSYVPLGSPEEADFDRNLEQGKGIVIILCVALLMGIVVLVFGALGLLLRRLHRRSNRRTEMFPIDGKMAEVSYCKAMCASHLEPDAGVDAAAAAAASSCRYIVHHCVCQEGHHHRQQQVQFAEKNSYVPVRLGVVQPLAGTGFDEEAAAATPPPPPLLGSLGLTTEPEDGRDRSRTERLASVANSPTHHADFAAAVVQARDALAVPSRAGNVSSSSCSSSCEERDSCSCGLYDYAFWKTQGSYCPVYGGQGRTYAIAENVLQ